MPSPLVQDAPPSISTTNKSREREKMGERRNESPAVCETDDGAVTSKAQNKQSFDYLWRTGLVGGLAGSAVCRRSCFPAVSDY